MYKIFKVILYFYIDCKTELIFYLISFYPFKFKQTLYFKYEEVKCIIFK